ncbi:MAG: alanine racemase [Phycisphaerales bacterium]|nr:alanine racemase [Phycisphaerales bacterium]
MPNASRFDPATYPLPDVVRDAAMSPALVVHLNLVRDNVRRVIDLLGGDPNRWRPHLKTQKIPQVWATLVDAGVRHFKCATSREAACLLDLLDRRDVVGADLLVAYPVVGPTARRIAELADAHPATQIGILCDDPDEMADLPANLDVFIDLNPGFDRTGLPVDDVARIAGAIDEAGPRFRGLHCFDGHIRMADPVERHVVAHRLYDRLVDVIERLADDGREVPELITSGTRTFCAAATYPRFARPFGATTHRIAAGTVIMQDLATAEFVPEAPGVPAAVILSRIVSAAVPGIVTCDAGAKTLAAEQGDPVAIVVGRDDLVARRPTEEHMALEVRGGARPRRGDAVLLVPRHVCPTINLAEYAVLVDDGRFVDVVPVAARAHELKMLGTPTTADR